MDEWIQIRAEQEYRSAEQARRIDAIEDWKNKTELLPILRDKVNFGLNALQFLYTHQDAEVPEGKSKDSAFDGDADIALALLLADAQWGSGGKVNYRAAASEVISGIGESTIGPESHLPLLGDWVNPQGTQYNQYTIR